MRRGSDGHPLVTGETVMVIFVPRPAPGSLPVAGARALESPSAVGSVQVRGVGDDVLSVRPEARLIEGRWPHFGGDEAIIGSGLVGHYPGIALGGHLTLKKGRDTQCAPLTVANRNG